MLIQHFQHLPMICTVHDAVYHQLLTQCIIYVRIHWSCCVLVLMQGGKPWPC